MNKPLFWLHGNPVTTIELLLSIAVLVITGIGIVRLRRALTNLTSAEGESRTSIIAITLIPMWLAAAVGIVLALDLLKVHLPSAAVFAGLLSIAAAAALQPVLSAAATGLLLRLERPFAVGDRITVGRIEGDVKAIRLRSIVLRTPANALVTIPNTHLSSAAIVNWSSGDRKLRLRIPVVVGHGADLKKTTTVLQRAAESSSRVVKSPAPRVLLTRSDKSGHRFEIWAWISGPGDRAWARNELYRAIDGELRKAHIRMGGGKSSSTNTPSAEAIADTAESPARESRGGRERRRREAGDRPPVATERQTEVLREPEAAQQVEPSPAMEREFASELPAPAPSGPSEERSQTYGRSKRRTPRR